MLQPDKWVIGRVKTMAIDVQVQELRVVNARNETILDLDLIQGSWTQAQYLKMTNHTRHLLEFTDGSIEVLPMPTDKHQFISRFLLFALFSFVQPRGGT